VQYDSSQYRVLTDFLASYEFHRGTVVDAGYDPLIERRDSINGKCVPGSDDYFASQRGLFFRRLTCADLSACKQDLLIFCVSEMWVLMSLVPVRRYHTLCNVTSP
jgi:hypothetical protein